MTIRKKPSPFLFSEKQASPSRIRHGLDGLAEFFFPSRCLICGKIFKPENSSYFCNTCYDGFLFIHKPVCSKCGAMFPTEQGEDHLCGQCLKSEPAFDRARSIGLYEGTLRKAIHGFKYNRKSLLGKPLSLILAEQGRKLITPNTYDALIPVPLHSNRLRQRGFNQAQVMARKAGKAWRIPVDWMSLQRKKTALPQTMLSKNARRKNIRDSFYCIPDSIKGKKLLLIDDVYTSGSTANECAKTLKKNGATTVDVLTLARTQ